MKYIKRHLQRVCLIVGLFFSLSILVYAYDDGTSLYSASKNPPYYNDQYAWNCFRYITVNLNGGQSSDISYRTIADYTGGNVTANTEYVGLATGCLVKDKQGNLHYVKKWSDNQTPKEGTFFQRVDTIGVTPYLTIISPTKPGYTFDGFSVKLSSGVYSGATKTNQNRYYFDVGSYCTGYDGNTTDAWLNKNPSITITANWKENSKYYFDLNGCLDNNYQTNISGYGTCDIYVNGILIADDVSDFYQLISQGSLVEIKDIRADNGRTFDGIHNGSLSFYMPNQKCSTELAFSSKNFTANMLHYKQVKDQWIQFDTTSQSIKYGCEFKPSFVTAPNGYYGHSYQTWTYDYETYLGSDTITMPCSDTISEVYYYPNTYMLTINPNGGTYPDKTTYSIKYNENILIPPPTRVGYHFVGWDSSDTVPQSISQDYGKGDLSPGDFSKTNYDTYTNFNYISDESQKYNGITTDYYSVNAGETITISGYIRINKTMNGLNFYHGDHYNDQDNSKLFINNTNKQWQYFEISRTFTTETNTACFQIYTGDIGVAIESINFDLKGINVKRSDGSNVFSTCVVMNAGNTTLIAQWEANEYTLYYDGNGATDGSMAKQILSFDTWSQLSSNDFQRCFNVQFNCNGGYSSQSNLKVNSSFLGWLDQNTFEYGNTSLAWYAFDTPYYANAYNDLFENIGYNKYALIKHFFDTTILGNENRRSSELFSISYYMTHFPDLTIMYGDNKSSYLEHWINHGFDESRLGAPTIDTSISNTYPNMAKVVNLSTEPQTIVLKAKWQDHRILMPTASKIGWDFIGWNTASDNSGISYRANENSPIISSNTTFYAQWSNDAPKFDTSKLNQSKPDFNKVRDDMFLSGIKNYPCNGKLIVQKGDPAYYLSYVKAIDIQDGDISDKIIIENDPIPYDENKCTTKAGNYTVTLSVTDLAGTKTTQEIDIIVNESPVLIAKDRYYILEDIIDKESLTSKIEVYDLEDQDIRDEISIISIYDTNNLDIPLNTDTIHANQPSTYLVKYRVIDQYLGFCEADAMIYIVNQKIDVPSIQNIRYISLEYLNTLDPQSQWSNNTLLNQNLKTSLSKEITFEDALYVIQFDDSLCEEMKAYITNHSQEKNLNQQFLNEFSYIFKKRPLMDSIEKND